MTLTLSATAAALVLLSVFVGVALQRVSGTGAGLVLAPMLTLIIGPDSGVLITNVTTAMSTVLLTIAMRRDIDWPRALPIMAFALPGAFLGALVVGQVSEAWLQVLVGALVLGAIGTTVLVAALGRLPHYDRPWLAPVGGFLGGTLNTIAGVGAPPMVILAKLTRWDHRSFAATAQPVFMTMGTASVLAKLSMDSVSAALPPLWIFPASIGAVVLAIWVGGLVARRVSGTVAGEIAMALAALGGLSALVRGLLQVF